MWNITKDYISKPEDGEKSRASFFSSHRSKLEEFNNEKNKYEFRLLDDDMTVYFEGLISQYDLEGYAEQAFAPLDYFQGSYGVTIMQYKKPRNKTWITL